MPGGRMSGLPRLSLSPVSVRAFAPFSGRNRAWPATVYPSMVIMFASLSCACRRSLRLLLAAPLVLLAAGCAIEPTVRLAPPALEPGGPIPELPALDVLGVSPEMAEFLDRYVLPYENRDTRLRLLGLSVARNGALGFHYDESRTLTASEAFATRSGNCLGFSSMFVALAREAGLQAHYQQVELEPEWYSREDTLLVAKHVNVLAGSGADRYVVDVSGLRIRPQAARRLLTDAEAEALHYNNLGAEALLRDELPTAWAYFSKAIETAPRLPDSWTNLGVVLRRNGQDAAAEMAYRQALEIDPGEYAAMSNLYQAFVDRGNEAAAADLAGKVERYRRKNPYYLLHLSEEAVLEARYEQALKLLEQALEKKDDDHLLHFALARSQYLAGRTRAAELSMERARALAPESERAHYGRPLHELAAEPLWDEPPD